MSETEIDKLISLAENAPKFRPEFVIESLRKMERHVEADLIEAQRDYIEVLERRLKDRPTKRHRRKNGP